MATNNGPGIDAAFREANHQQDLALASLDRVHRETQRVSRQSTVEVLKEAEETPKSTNWIEKRGF